MLVVYKIVHATIVICRLATREIVKTLISLRSAQLVNLHLTACVLQSLNKLLFLRK
jgi:hypothetical protein